MDTDPESQRARWGAAATTEFALHLNRALDGLDDRGELRDQSIARSVGDPAVVTFDEFGEDTPRGVQRAERAYLSSASIARL